MTSDIINYEDHSGTGGLVDAVIDNENLSNILLGDNCGIGSSLSNAKIACASTSNLKPAMNTAGNQPEDSGLGAFHGIQFNLVSFF